MISLTQQLEKGLFIWKTKTRSYSVGFDLAYCPWELFQYYIILFNPGMYVCVLCITFIIYLNVSYTGINTWQALSY